MSPLVSQFASQNPKSHDLWASPLGGDGFVLGTLMMSSWVVLGCWTQSPRVLSSPGMPGVVLLLRPARVPWDLAFWECPENLSRRGAGGIFQAEKPLFGQPGQVFSEAGSPTGTGRWPQPARGSWAGGG